MSYYVNDYDAEPDSFITVKPFYKTRQPKNSNVLFDFELTYVKTPESDEDGNQDLDLSEYRTICLKHECDRGWIIGRDPDHIKTKVNQILDIIDYPRYSDIVRTLTKEILSLKKPHKVEKIEVALNTIVERFPGEIDEYVVDDDVDVEVRLAVAPAGEEAVVQHLETVVLENEGYCVICMDKIRVGSDVETGRMPCMHVFHRTCGEDWLRSSGTCPLCRAVFPN